MNEKMQFIWFLMNAVLMCIFIVPVAFAFWLSVFVVDFDWVQWVKIANDAVKMAASDTAKALDTIQTYWGIFSFILLVAYSAMFTFKVKKQQAEKEKHSFATTKPDSAEILQNP